MLENLLTDRRVVRRVLRGNTESFRIIVDRYGGMLYGLAYAHLGNAADAEDAVQDTFVRLWQWLDRVSVERTLGPWLVRVARTLIIDVSRHRATERQTLAELAQTVDANKTDYARREIYAAMWTELSSLDPEQREVLILSYFQGHRAKDIAALLDISTDAAQKRLQRAREELGRRLLDCIGRETIGRRPDRKRADRVMSAIAATPIAWKAGASLSLSGAVIVGASATKIVAGIAAIGLIAVVSALCFLGVGWPGRHQAPDITASSQFTVSDTPAPAAPAPTQSSPAAPAAATTPPADATADAPAALAPKSTDGMAQPDFYSAVYGVVVDESGQPVPGAQVGIDSDWEVEKRLSIDRHVREQSMTTTSDREGRFRFASLPVKMISRTIPEKIWAQSGNLYGVLDIDLDRPSPEHYLEIVVRPSQPLGGTVVDDKGATLPDAYVGVTAVVMDHPLDVTWQIQAISDKNGRFLFQHLIPGYYEIRASAEGFKTISGEKYETGRTDVVVTLERGCTISGRVLGPEGSPVGGFNLSAQSVDGRTLNGVFIPKAFSRGAVEDDGRFLIGGLDSGAYDIWVQPKGGPTRYALAEPMRVTVEKDLTGVEVRVVLGGRVTGRVLDAASGSGIDEARVIGVDKTGGNGAEATTASDGTYVLEGVPVGEVKVVAEKDDYEKAEMTLPKVEPDADLKGIDVRMKEMPAVKGVVVDSTGTPVAQIPVVARDGLGKEEFSAVSDDAGKFRVHIKANVNSIYLQAISDTGVSELLGPLDPFAQEYELRLRETGRLEGEVVDSSGNPMGYTVIDAAPEDETALQIGQDLPHYLTYRQKPTKVTIFSDSHGNFLSGPLLPGAYKLEILDFNSLTALATAETEVPEGRTVHARLVVDTSEYGAIEGMITDHGKPAPGVWVKPFIGNWNCQSTPAEPDGHYSLPLVMAGRGYVEVIKNVAAMNVVQMPVEITAGQTTELNIDVSGTGTGAEGFVDVDGQRIARMPIVFTKPESGEEITEATTDWDGHYSVDPLPEGPYRAIVKVRLLKVDPPFVGQDPPVYCEPTDVQVKNGEMTRLDFHLKGGVISGAVRGIGPGEWAYVGLFGGAPVPEEITPELLASLLAQNVVQMQKLTQDGPLTFQLLLPGDYGIGAVIVSAGQEFLMEPVMKGLESGRFDIQQLQLVPGQAINVEVNLGGRR